MSRDYIFLICIAIRSLIAVTAYIAGQLESKTLLQSMGVIALVPAVGFALIWAFGLRKTGMEVGGNIIWWDFLRPIHAFMYLSFAVFAIRGSQYAYINLIIDVVIGIFAFIGETRFKK